MLEPVSGQMYRPMYNGVNIEIHNVTPPHHEPIMPPPRPQNEGQYACPRCGYYDIPKVSIYDSDSAGDDVSRKTRIADRVLIVPQQTIVNNNNNNNNHHIADRVVPQKVVHTQPTYVTTPIQTVKPEEKQDVKKETEKPVETKKPEQPAEKAEQPATPKKIEVVKPIDLKPAIDINTFIAELTSPDFARQADAMGTITKVCEASPEIGAHLLDVKLIDALVDIIMKDTTNLPAPTPQQLGIRDAIMRGYDVSPQHVKYASQKAPVELAEQNKEYAMYTLASLQKIYGAEVDKMGGTVRPLRDLPGMNEIIKEVETNGNPHVKVAGLTALNYAQRPEYKADLQAIYQKAANDENPIVRETAQKAIQLLG